MKLILIFVALGSLAISSCNTVMGTAKGVGRDAKAVFIYSRDAVTGKPISD